jgi:hypothetical protein
MNYCPLCGMAADKCGEMDIEKYEWKTVPVIDVGWWAATKQGWSLFKVVQFIGKDEAILFRPKSGGCAMRLVVYHCRDCETSITERRGATKHASVMRHRIERHEWSDCPCDLCKLYAKIQEEKCGARGGK